MTRPPLPEPLAPLSPDQRAVRRAVDRDFDGDANAAGRAVGLAEGGLERHLTGREAVPHELLERLADALGYSVDQLRAPHPHAVWNPDDGWITPGDTHYDEVRQLVRAAGPASAHEEDDEL